MTEANVNLRYKDVVSPVDGVIFDLKPTGPGFVAQSSEPVMKIVPFNALQAKINIKSSDIGFIQLNKRLVAYHLNFHSVLSVDDLIVQFILEIYPLVGRVDVGGPHPQNNLESTHIFCGFWVGLDSNFLTKFPPFLISSHIFSDRHKQKIHFFTFLLVYTYFLLSNATYSAHTLQKVTKK